MEEVQPSLDNCTLEVLPSLSSGHRKSHLASIVVLDTRLRLGVGISVLDVWGEWEELLLYTGEVGGVLGAPRE